jgi:RNA polymerase II subunit A C-terminal domain phosphatase SSU72
MGGKLRFAMVCASNMNRSMEAHHVLKGAGLTVTSYGVGGHVKLPGKSTTPARMMGI